MVEEAVTAVDHGQFVERVELSNGGTQLKYSVRLKLRVLTEPVTVHRVFDRGGA